MGKPPRQLTTCEIVDRRNLLCISPLTEFHLAINTDNLLKART